MSDAATLPPPADPWARTALGESCLPLELAARALTAPSLCPPHRSAGWLAAINRLKTRALAKTLGNAARARPPNSAVAPGRIALALYGTQARVTACAVSLPPLVARADPPAILARRGAIALAALAVYYTPYARPACAPPRTSGDLSQLGRGASRR